jgi:DNA-directed RNA polymerase subunit beta
LRLTYGRPFRVWLRLNKEQPIEEEVYLGDMPIMLGGGEFIINGAERVVVSQLHRSPGVDFVLEAGGGDRKLPSCRVIPERGSWIEINVTKKDSAERPHRPERQVLGHDAAAGDGPQVQHRRRSSARSTRRPREIVDGRSAAKIEGKIAVDDVVYPAGQRAGRRDHRRGRAEDHQERVPRRSARRATRGRGDGGPKTPLILNSLAEDNTSSHEEALLRIYQRLRPGNPPQLEKAKTLFHEKFFDVNRYRWAASAASASTASSKLTCPRRR